MGNPAEQGAPDAAPEDIEEPGFWREFFDFLKENRRWWMAPLLLALLLIGGLLFLAGTHSALAPFIYTLF